MQMLIENMPKPPRPKADDSGLFAAVAENLAKEIMQPGETDIDDVKRGLVDALDACGGSYDGYKIASYLDRRYGWEVDALLVDTLDSAGMLIDHARNDIIAGWVSAYQIKPEHAVGDSVTLINRGKQVTGSIVGVYEKQAKYTVNVPELGHAPQGGLYVDYEAVSKA